MAPAIEVRCSSSHEGEVALRRALSPRDGYLARLDLAVLYTDTDRLLEAEQIYREGIVLQPDHRERLEGLADFLSDTGRDAEADEWYERARVLPTREERRRRRRNQN